MRTLNVLIADGSKEDSQAIIGLIEEIKPGCNFVAEKDSERIIRLIEKEKFDLIVLDESLFSKEDLFNIIDTNIMNSKAYLGIFTSSQNFAEKILAEFQCDGAFVKNSEYDIFCKEIYKYFRKVCAEAV